LVVAKVITLTENAAKHIKTLLADPGAQGKALRVYIETGGCSFR
jgi:Fe-S cluster assembly iron-binding protein IscA